MANQIPEFQKVLSEIGFYDYVKEHSGLGDEMPDKAELAELTSIVLAKESGGNPDAKVTSNKTKYTVSGICQFTNATYKECLNKLNDEMKNGALARINEITNNNYTTLDEVPDDVLLQNDVKNDLKLQAYAFSDYWAGQFSALKQNGIEIDANSVAIMHQYSADGPAILKGDPNTPVTELNVFKVGSEEGLTAAKVDERLKKNGLTRESTFGDILEKTEKATGEFNERLAQEKIKAGKELLKDYELVLGHMTEKGGEEDKKQAQLARQAFESGDLDSGLKITGDYLDKTLGLDDKRKDLSPSQKNMARVLGVTLGIDETNIALDNPDKKLSEIAPEDRVNKLHGMFKDIPGIPAAGDLTAGIFLENADEIQRRTAAKAAEKAKDGDWMALIKEFGPMLGSILGSGPEGLLMVAIIACVAMAMFGGDDKEKNPQATAQQQAQAAAAAVTQAQVAYAGDVDKWLTSDIKADDTSLQDLGTRVKALNIMAADFGPEKTQAIMAALHKGDSAPLLQAIEAAPYDAAVKQNMKDMFSGSKFTSQQMEAAADGYEAVNALVQNKAVDIKVGGTSEKIDLLIADTNRIQYGSDNIGKYSSEAQAEVGEVKQLLAKINAASARGVDAFQVTSQVTPATPAATPQQRGG